MNHQVTLEPTTSQAPAAKAFILQLPDELLVLIVEFAANIPGLQAKI
jgi:hypothetical protein